MGNTHATGTAPKLGDLSMANHWPLVIALAVISMAAALGLWQHDQAVNAASIRIVNPPAPVAKPKPAAPKPVAQLPEAAPAAPALAQPAIETVPVDPNPKRKKFVTTGGPIAPTAPAPLVATPAPTAPTAPVVVHTTPLALPAAPATPGVAQDRTKVLNDLKTALQNQFGILPMELAAGGFALNTDGARIEVQPPPNWSASVYNINPKGPETETANFKVCMDLVIKSLGIDMTQKPVEAGNGKTYLKTSSKLGSISMMRDPATGNSCLIRPIGQWTPTPPAKVDNGAGVVQQPRPARQVPQAPVAPAAPPRPPATDANF
jgi:hypothetical protein